MEFSVRSLRCNINVKLSNFYAAISLSFGKSLVTLSPSVYD